MKKIIYLDNIIYKEYANINVNTPIVNFGLLLYETLLVKDSIPIFFDAHLKRLFCAIEYLKVKIDKNRLYNSLKQKVQELLDIKYICTQQARLKILLIPKDISNHNIKFKKFSHLIILSEINNSKKYYKYYVPNIVKNTNNIIPYYVKLNSNLRNILAAKEAHENNCDEGLLFNSSIYLCEGSFSNVFIVQDKNTIATPHLRNNLLSGITRVELITILRKANYQIEETDISYSKLIQAKEVFLTSAIRGVACVKSITFSKDFYKSMGIQNQKRIYNFFNHRITQNIKDVYNNCVQDYIERNKKNWNH